MIRGGYCREEKFQKQPDPTGDYVRVDTLPRNGLSSFTVTFSRLRSSS